MKKMVIAGMVLGLFLATVFATDVSGGEGKVLLTGYLTDKHCLDMKNPSDDTVMCLMMEKCEADGYGIAVEQSDGSFRFFRFDSEGQSKAKDVLSCATKEKLNKITVTGKIDGETILVKTLKEN